MPNQARLPGTLPTPTQARGALKLARNCVREKENVADGLKERLAAARDEVAAAKAEMEEAEVDLVEADEDSPQEKTASVTHEKSYKRRARAQLDEEKVAKAYHLAQAELRVALKALENARSDIEAIREGRRKGG